MVTSKPYVERISTSVVTQTRFLRVQESVWKLGPAMHPRCVSDVDGARMMIVLVLAGVCVIFCILLAASGLAEIASNRRVVYTWEG